MNHTKKIRITLAAACAFGLATGPGQALEIDPHVAPQVDIGGRALITTKAHRVKEADGGSDSDSELEFADSSLLFGFAKYLFDSENYAFGAIGIKAIEDDAHHDVRDDIYLHQMHAGVGGERFEVMLGRTGLPNTLVVFPTLRDDDLLEFTHVGNAFSHAPDEVYQLYGGVVQGTWFWPAQRMSATGTVTARTETDGTGSRTSSSDFNGYNLKFAYDVPEAIKFDRGLRYTALAWDRQDLKDGEGEMDAFQAGAVINLSDNPEATWNLDLQATYVNGISVPDLDSIANPFKGGAEVRGSGHPLRPPALASDPMAGGGDGRLEGVRRLLRRLRMDCGAEPHVPARKRHPRTGPVPVSGQLERAGRCHRCRQRPAHLPRPVLRLRPHAQQARGRTRQHHVP
jgi:hypothetical protein